jgi:hypothetical protein
MPAIHPEKFYIQIDELLNDFENPEQFTSKLINLFDMYSNRIRRVSQSGIPQPLIKQYYIPKPILRHITQRCIPLCSQYPVKSLALIDSLWEQNVLEFQLIAGQLLGHMPIEHEDEVISRIYKWNINRSDPVIRHLFGTASFYTIRNKSPDNLINLIDKWLNDENTDTKKLAISVLLTIVEENQYKNLAAIFNLCSFLIQLADKSIRTEVITLAETLIYKYPSEMAYLYKAGYQKQDNKNIIYLIRKTLKKFPEDIQISLRRLLTTQDQT